jgi:hypothetical protein
MFARRLRRQVAGRRWRLRLRGSGWDVIHAVTEDIRTLKLIPKSARGNFGNFSFGRGLAA